MTREEFKAAFDEAVSREFDFLADMPEHKFSARFELKMRRLIKTIKRTHRLPLRSLPKSVLTTAVAACFLVIVSFMQVDAISEPIINFISTAYKKFILITFDNNSTLNYISCEYQITDIPAGFTITDFNKNSDSIYTMYENTTGDIIRLVQNTITHGSQIHLDNENSEIKNLTISNMEVLLYTSDFSIMALWVQDNYNMILTCIGDFDEATVIKMIESVEAVEPATE